jgi:hypothetical protein
MLIVQDVETWNRTVDLVADELLGEAGWRRPPVDVLRLASRLRVDVAFDAGQRARGRHKKLAGRPAILLKPDERPERVQWAAAHELGEVFASRVCEQLGLAGGELPEGGREMLANLLATRLLLPWMWFAADARATQCDLLLLKEIYRTASHELIAWRLLDLPEWSIVTVFDQGHLMRRRSSNGAKPPMLQLPERRCRDIVYRESRAANLCEAGLVVHGWPIHEPGWKREILRTTADADE